MRQVLIYPGEDGFWVAECPSLPGCASQGASREEAIENVREAIQAYTAEAKEGFHLIPDEKAVLLRAVGQAERGQVVDGWQLLDELKD